MANEFSENFNVQCNNGNYKFQFVKGNGSYNQNAQGSAGGLATITTTAANIDVGSVTTLGKCLLHNCDVTNYISVGTNISSTFTPCLKIEPDEFCWLRLDPSVTLMAKAHTASCELEYIIFQD